MADTSVDTVVCRLFEKFLAVAGHIFTGGAMAGQYLVALLQRVEAEVG